MPKQQTPELLELDKLLGCTDLSGYTVTRHGYRIARVIGDDVTDGPLNYRSGDRIARLQARLAAATGSRLDNHETYVVLSPDGQKICLWFHDWSLFIGTATQPY